MHVRRGSAGNPAADAELTSALLADAVATGEDHLRVWRPPPHCSFGRRDTSAAGYEAARGAAREGEFPPIERETGGGPVVHTGSTVAVALATTHQDPRGDIEARYDAVLRPVQRALWRLGVPAQRGEPPDSFCPGSHSLAWEGKLAGFAQRVERGGALVTGIVLSRDHEVVASVLGPVHRALDRPFDPDSVGSLARAGGRASPDEVVRVIESAVLGDRQHTIEVVGDTPKTPADRED